MLELKWDETDFLDCLEVFPDVEEDGDFYSYEVIQNDLAMTVSVWPYASCIHFSLRQRSDAKPNIDCGFIVRKEIVYVYDKETPCLEFRDCLFTQHWSLEWDYTEQELKTNKGQTIRIGIKPQIWIEFV